jgi:2-polyprenyl-3-methyl-5-hydroxy-6-metoxy-1,4-benzoquinol methylase
MIKLTQFHKSPTNLKKRYDKFKDSRIFYRDYILELQKWGREQKIDEANLIERPCPLCKTDNARAAFKAPVYDFVQCENCGLVYAKKILNDFEISKFYSNNPIYQLIWAKTNENIIATKNLPTQKPLVDKILSTRKGDGACLDIGCAHGKLLHELRSHFATVEGIELNEVVARQCEELFGINVYKKRLEELNLPSQSYDVVILSQVIEHLNSLELFEDIFRILKPNGIVYIGCPNADAWSMRLLKGRHIHVSTHAHINMFNINSIKFLADKYGFDLISGDVSNNLDFDVNDVILFKTNDFVHRYSCHPITLPLSLIVGNLNQMIFNGTNIVARLQAGSYLEAILVKK